MNVREMIYLLTQLEDKERPLKVASLTSPSTHVIAGVEERTLATLDDIHEAVIIILKS